MFNMKKTTITIIKVGYTDRLLNLKKIKKWKSDIFEIFDPVEIQSLKLPLEDQVSDGYLDIKFTRESMEKFILSSGGNLNLTSDFVVPITSYRFTDNFFMHRITNNIVSISIYGISKILEREKIPLENFIIKQLYEICALKRIFTDISYKNKETYSIYHKDTRGCLFDLNGDRTDIIYNTEKPILCNSCKTKFDEKGMPKGQISILEKELKRLQKPFIVKVEKHIRRHPLLSIVISALIGSAVSSSISGFFSSSFWRSLTEKIIYYIKI